MNCIELYRIVDWKVYRLTFQSLDLDEIGWRSVHSRHKETMVLIPKKTRRQILEHLFKEGVMVVKKDYQAGFHRDFHHDIIIFSALASCRVDHDDQVVE